MLSYQVSDYYDFIQSQLSILESDEVIKSINDFAVKIEGIYNSLKEVILNGSSVDQVNTGIRYATSNNNNYIRTFTDAVEAFKQKFNFLDGHAKAQEIERDISTYIRENNIPNIEFSGIVVLLEDLKIVFKTYQSYIQSGTYSNMQSLSDACIEYCKCFRACVDSCKTYAVLSKGKIDVTSEEVREKTLEIRLLDTRYVFKEFTNILSLINDIYESIGNVIYTQGSTYEPLEIIKIESGSLLSMLLGDKNIVEAIGLFLTKTINLIFNKYTQEGQIYRHKELMDALQKEVELGDKLNSLGYNINDAKEDVEISYAHITKGLLQIVGSSAKIKVNDHEYSIKDEIRGKSYLSDTRVYMLENSKSDLEDK